jgi:hypothetical protein
MCPALSANAFVGTVNEVLRLIRRTLRSAHLLDGRDPVPQSLRGDKPIAVVYRYQHAHRVVPSPS